MISQKITPVKIIHPLQSTSEAFCTGYPVLSMAIRMVAGYTLLLQGGTVIGACAGNIAAVYASAIAVCGTCSAGAVCGTGTSGRTCSAAGSGTGAIGRICFVCDIRTCGVVAIST